MATIGGIEIKSITSDTSWGMCIALYGPPGVGKTLRACEACYSEYGGRVLLLDAEGGRRSVTHMADKVDFVEVNTWPKITSVTNAITKEDDCPYGTIVLDNMSEYQAISLRHLAGNEVAQIQHYNASTKDMLLLTRKWRDWAVQTGVNVIYIAWESPEKDEATGIIKRDVGFTPSLAKQFPGIVDIVGYMTPERRGIRKISFAPDRRTAAKFRRNKTEVAMEIPLEIYFDLDEMPIVDLLATLKGGKPWPKTKYTRPANAGE